MAIILKSNGEEQFVTPECGNRFSLEELQKIVGGYIELIYLRNYLMIVNEEGKIYNLPINVDATEVARFNQSIMPNDYIVGDVLICENTEIE